MEKKPFYYDKEKKARELAKLEFGKKTLQKLVDNYKEVKNLPPLEGDEFKSLYLSPKELIASKLIVKHNISFDGGLSIKASKVFELFDEPEGMTEIIKAQKTAYDEMSGFDNNPNNKRFDVRIELHEFELVNETIEIRKESIDALEKNCSYFLETERQKQIYNCLESISTSFKTILMLEEGIDVQDMFKSGLNYDLKSVGYVHQSMEINPQYILDRK
jgi:hypothetical protein